MESPPPPGLICPSCKRPVEPGHKFCDNCGTKMPELPPCRNCGAHFIAPVKFCELCGTPVGSDGDLQDSAEESQDSVRKNVEVTRAYEKEEPEGTGEDTGSSDPEHQEMARMAEDLIAPVPQPAPDVVPGDNPPKPAKAKRPFPVATVAGAVIVLLIIAAAIYFIGFPILAGGSAPPHETPAAATPLPTVVATLPTPLPETTEPVVTMPVFSLVPEPTQALPENQEVIFEVQKDPVYSKITVILAGGPGINSISSGEITVSREDGTVIYGTIRPSTGVREVVLDGSKGTDRVEIIAKMYTGQTYRVYDDLLSYKAR